MTKSLWGEAFEIPNTKDLVKKVTKKAKAEPTEAQKLKSKKTSIEEKIELITNNVYKVLGHYKYKISVI